MRRVRFFTPMEIDPTCCHLCGHDVASHSPVSAACGETTRERIANRLSRLYVWKES